MANYKFVILLDAKTKVTKLFRNQGPEAAVEGPRVSKLLSYHWLRRLTDLEF